MFCVLSQNFNALSRKKMYASSSKKSMELKNGIEILVDQVVFQKSQKYRFDQ